MTDKNDKFEPTENIDDSDFEESNNTSETTIIYSLLILITGLGFVIGAIISGILVGGTLCVFESMTVFTSGLGTLGAEQDIQQMAIDTYMNCLYGSILSPITLISGFIGGFAVAYPTYNTIKKIMNGQKLRTML